MIRAMNPLLPYQILRQILQMLTQLARDGGAKDALMTATPRDPPVARPRRNA
jgi:hypothetical protein